MRRLSAILLAALVSASPATARAADDEDAKQKKDRAVRDALEEFEKAPKTSSGEKAAAVRLLMRRKDPRLLNALIGLLADPQPAGRIEAIRGIGAYHKNPVASQALVSALRAARKEPGVELACLQALGRVQDWGSVPTVIDYFKTGEPKVEKAAIAAAGEIRSPDFVNTLINMLRDTGQVPGEQGRARGGPRGRGGAGKARLHHDEARQALRKITGNRKLDRAEAWEDWWKRHGARVTEELRREDQEARERAGREQAGG